MKIAFPISILLAHCLSNSCGEKISVLPEARTEVSEEVAFEKLLDIEMNIKNGVEYIIKSALPFVIRQGDDFQLSVGCVAALMKTMFALRDMKLWPFEMLDATGKPGAGMLSGTLSHLGSYHQCLRVKIPDSSHGKLPPQTGQYCMIMLRPPLPPKPKPLLIFKSVFQRNNATFNTELMREINKLLFGAYVTGAKYGVCIPSACSQEDLGVMVDSAASMLGVYIEIDGCEVPEPFQMDFVQKLVSGILLSIVLVCLVVTLISEIQKHCLDESRRDQKKTYKQLILEALSIVDNFRKLMKTKPVKKHSLNSMNGLRFLSMTWVVLGHSYCLIPKNFAREPIHMLKSREDFFFTAIAGAFMSVESFVFITGTLLSYHLVTYFDQSRTYKPILVIVHRVWRFWPSIALMTGLMILTPLVGSGPDYKQIMEDQADMCRKHWWRNFVFINNWHQINKQCLAHFWYLAVDMQCFLVGLLYFFVLFK